MGERDRLVEYGGLSSKLRKRFKTIENLTVSYELDLITYQRWFTNNNELVTLL